jgi:mannan endo-1,6-alpha-mannosidase
MGLVASIRQAATTIAASLWQFYVDRPYGFIGMLDIPPPEGEIPWWASGAFWGTMVDYRHATGDRQYDESIREALLFQSGDQHDYLPSNWSHSIGNDDQAFWALAAMSAAETNLIDPPPDEPQYLALGQAVFHQQTQPERRAPADSPCRSGLRWQILPANDNYRYINTISNVCYFNLGVRLGRYTNNQTYVDNAVSVVENLFRLKYIDDDYNVFDGAHLPNCGADTMDVVQYSYNAAILLHGAAFMYNMVSKCPAS